MNVDTNMESNKLQNMKVFVSSAREYIAFHTDKALNTMNKCLMNISSLDASSFCPGKLEVSAFFATLWEVMAQASGPHWAGISALSKAVLDPSTLHALIHKYRFLPVLAKMLTDNLSIEKKMKLLVLMEVLSYSIKITWEEAYLADLLKVLASWVVNYNTSDPQTKSVSNLALAVLINLCSGNSQVVLTLMRTVDTREMIKRLVSLKEGDIAGVQVCRLLMALQESRGAPTSHDVKNFLAETMQAFVLGIKNCDATQLRHSSTFFLDLCTNSQTKTYVINYDRYDAPLQEVIKLFPLLLSKTSSEDSECDGNKCLQSTLKFLLALVKTELYSLRPFYSVMAELCVKSTHISNCMPFIYSLLAAIITQYHEDGMLPDEVMSVLSPKFNEFLAPKSLDPKTCGLEWIQLVSALCECNATQNGVIHNVRCDQFEGIVFDILHTALQKGNLDSNSTYDSVIIACNLCLDLAQISSPWESVLQKMLSNNSVQKVLSSCLSTTKEERRKQALSVIKHPRFPTDRINQVFCAVQPCTDLNSSLENGYSNNGIILPEISPSQVTSLVLTASQESSLDKVILKLNLTLENNEIEDISVSSIMELYGCKLSCLEQRLHACSVALQGATHNVASLNHSMALLQATNKNQQEVLYRTQVQNEKLKENVRKLSDHLGDAEQSVKRFQGKLAAERLDREQQLANSNHRHTQKIKELEGEIENKEAQISAATAQLTEMEANNKSMRTKLTEQTAKNNELAGVLVKFEERVKQRDKKLEETTAYGASMKSDLNQAQQTIKTMEKTLLEREKRLTQLTSQLEEMNRIQEIIAGLMGNKGASTNSSNNSMN